MNEKISKAEEQVTTLMEDIKQIKQDNDNKVNDILKVHQRELEAMKIENACLRKEIK